MMCLLLQTRLVPLLSIQEKLPTNGWFKQVASF